MSHIFTLLFTLPLGSELHCKNKGHCAPAAVSDDNPSELFEHLIYVSKRSFIFHTCFLDCSPLIFHILLCDIKGFHLLCSPAFLLQVVIKYTHTDNYHGVKGLALHIGFSRVGSEGTHIANAELTSV